MTVTRIYVPAEREPAQHRLYIIGQDSFNESGIQPPTLKNRPLTLLPKQITSANCVYSGFKSSLYTTSSINPNYPRNSQRIWSAGCNDCGQCCTGIPDEQQSECAEITYFDRNKIKIHKICMNPIAKTVFFICHQGYVYGVGGDYYGQLGVEKENIIKGRSLPIRIEGLKNAMDVQSARSYSIALCKHKEIENPLPIIHRWSEDEGINIPGDISEVIVKYLEYTKVFSTKKVPLASPFFTQRGCGWKEMKHFRDKTVIAIALSSAHVLFLEDNGTVWKVWRKAVIERHIYPTHHSASRPLGVDANRAIALRETIKFSVPRKMKIFEDQKIKIKEIACGVSHSLALDENGNLYSWGGNGCGQCGVGTSRHIMVPTMIDMGGKRVDVIRCGYTHSYVRTVCGGHYLFGDNSHGECMTFDDRVAVLEPHRINNILMKMCRIRSVLDVFPGYHNTKLFCEVVGVRSV